MRALRTRIFTVALATILLTGLSAIGVHQVAVAQYTQAESHDEGFNDEYIFATTKSVSRMDGVNPALKLTLYPVTVVLDTAFLPFAIVAGYVS